MTNTLRGEGEILYDYTYDILTYRTKGRQYEHSIESKNFTADIDVQGYITGMQIEDASVVLGIPKYALRDIKRAEFTSQTSEGKILVELNLHIMRRNKAVPAGVPEHKSLQFIQDAPMDMPDSVVEAVA